MKTSILKSVLTVSFLTASLIATAQTSSSYSSAGVVKRTESAVSSVGHEVSSAASSVTHEASSAVSRTAHKAKRKAVAAKNKVKKSVKNNTATDGEAPPKN